MSLRQWEKIQELLFAGPRQLIALGRFGRALSASEQVFEELLLLRVHRVHRMKCRRSRLPAIARPGKGIPRELASQRRVPVAAVVACAVVGLERLETRKVSTGLGLQVLRSGSRTVGEPALHLVSRRQRRGGQPAAESAA